ncbi:hypothetical protein TVNIR_1345 [Thioalkalivibrio nitratireducens DSM 14787]|uniref:Uncharacterized protein n=1 Tax=Thioalkalivibrio nitratireducens (strain DSM 14787 / UNIQEM 213 / ALEN2) TaxID=1255043 RepID=L0DXD3_THIND|nr:hypothetical protein [Thioalkalivibrio nitratireducens]AGA33016.1 hypothetical protein TVNIR_1345 [Thioalkalivibrio nitratireducens DSM 14787]
MNNHDPQSYPDSFITGTVGPESLAVLEQQLAEHRAHLAALRPDAPLVHRAHVLLDIGETLIGLERKPEAWETVRPLVEPLVAAEAWQEAVEACDLLYRAEQDDSILALGHGVWLGVTYPVKAQTTVTMLTHVVDETPEQADGAAVAAMVAHYIAGLRAEGRERDSLTFLTTQVISRVARRHRGIEDQETLNTWIDMYELNDTDKLFQRLSRMLDAIVGDHWWFDRDELRARLPVN